MAPRCFERSQSRSIGACGVWISRTPMARSLTTRGSMASVSSEWPWDTRLACIARNAECRQAERVRPPSDSSDPCHTTGSRHAESGRRSRPPLPGPARSGSSGRPPRRPRLRRSPLRGPDTVPGWRPMPPVCIRATASSPAQPPPPRMGWSRPPAETFPSRGSLVPWDHPSVPPTENVVATVEHAPRSAQPLILGSVGSDKKNLVGLGREACRLC